MAAFFKRIEEVVRDARKWARSDHPRIHTGYSIMDSRTEGGAAQGEVILFQARSQVGKTVFACNVIENQPPERAIVFFSLEMNARYIALKLAAINSNMDSREVAQAVKAGVNTPLEALVASHPNLAIVDKPAMSLKEMSQALGEYEAEMELKPQLVVIDYMELIGGVPSIGGVDQVDRVARKIKDFTREHDVVTLVLHQVGRGEGGSGHIPLSMQSGRYGGETQADYVLAACRPCLRPDISQKDYLEERWQMMLQFLKTRGGSEIHPEPVLHQLNPFSMRIEDGWPIQPLFTDDPVEEPF